MIKTGGTTPPSNDEGNDDDNDMKRNKGKKKLDAELWHLAKFCRATRA